MKNGYKVLLLLTTFLFLLSACSKNFDTEQKEAQLAAEKAFQEDPEEANQSDEFIEYYLPFGFEIVEANPNNILLKNGSKNYILFYNQQEEANSEVVYNATVQQIEYDINKTFKDKDKFGFMLLKKLDDDTNELTVGFGGVKVTSEVKTSNLKTEASTMMTIANSVKRK